MAPRSVSRAPLARALGALRGAFLATLVISFFINLLMFVAPLYMLQVYDRVLTSRNETTLLMLTLLALALLALFGVLETIRARVLVRLGTSLDHRLRDTVFRAVFEAARQRPGSRPAQVMRDLEQVRGFLIGPGVPALMDAPWVPVFLAVIFLMHLWLGLLALGGAVLIFALALANELFTRTAHGESGHAATVAGNTLESSLRNAEVLRAMGMQEAVRTRWREHQETALGWQSLAGDRGGLIVATSKALRFMLQVGILGVGAWLAIHREITPGVMIAASIIMSRALAPVEQSVAHWRGFVNARLAWRRLGLLLQTFPEPPTPVSLPAPQGQVTVEGLTVAPPGSRTPVLRGVSVSLAPGEVLGVVGPSAAGKSSLARVLVGVWPPLSGAVRLDGASLDQWAPEHLGPHVGYLPQDVELFPGTVAENIARLGPVDDARVVAAAAKAGADAMIRHLPEGYNTDIGDGGQSLSGGQRQRVGLARALYGDPALVVLDEPNANLDREGESALAQAVKAMKDSGQTVVLITHRPALLSATDRVMVLEEGQIKALGPRDEILTRLFGPPPAARKGGGVGMTLGPNLAGKGTSAS